MLHNCFNSSSIEIGGIGTVWNPNNPTKKIIKIYSFLLLSTLLLDKKHVNVNSIGAVFSPNCCDIHHLYTTYIAFKLYTTQTVLIRPPPLNPKIPHCSKTVLNCFNTPLSKTVSIPPNPKMSTNFYVAYIISSSLIWTIETHYQYPFFFFIFRHTPILQAFRLPFNRQ